MQGLGLDLGADFAWRLLSKGWGSIIFMDGVGCRQHASTADSLPGMTERKAKAKAKAKAKQEKREQEKRKRYNLSEDDRNVFKRKGHVDGSVRMASLFSFCFYYSELGTVNTSRFCSFYLLWNEWFGRILEGWGA
jgi:hypothetical protein